MYPLAYRFTHNGIRTSESVDVDQVFMRMLKPTQLMDMLAFWCQQIHAGHQPGARGYEMPVEHDGRTDISLIPVAERV